MKKAVPISILLILLVATGIFFIFRDTNDEETPQEYNESTEPETTEVSQLITEEESLEDSDYIARYEVQNTAAEQARNLHKLSKVWGFVKYTHLAFLTGERCWDEELLALIPAVRFAYEGDVNNILYEWFIGLGDDGYDLDYLAFRSILLEDFPAHYDIIEDFFEDANNHSWLSVEGLHEELWLLNTGFEMNLHSMADLSWINEDYLGTSLAMGLSRFNKIQITDRAMAPVYFDMIGNSVFTNKERFVNIDYADSDYRLLGLFRLWNTVKYFFPYLDIIDYDWNELLLEYIPQMLEGADRFSYEVTLATLASRLQDAHIHFFRGEAWVWPSIVGDIFEYLFGPHYAPISVQEAEGRLVVSNVPPHRGIELMRGDVVLRVNGIDINEITTDMLQYLPYPNTEKALAFLVRDYVVLRQHSGAEPMAIDVYRLGEELRVYVRTVLRDYRFLWPHVALESHMILENNIGLINPSMIMYEAMYRNSVLRDIMTEFEEASINGLIIDLRQPPSSINYLLAEYLLEEQVHFVTASSPYSLVPGLFVDIFRGHSGYGLLNDLVQEFVEIGYTPEREESFGSFFHNQNTILLMNENSQSHTEFTIMTLRGGANVTVMGTNSIGANGNVTFLPLPGGIVMMFTGLGIYTPDGGQTQRIGLSPDIYVPRTIAGIRDGRDELMEAAIRFLR